MMRPTILMYHAIDHPRAPAEATLCCTPERFAGQIAMLLDAGATFVGLDQALACARGEAPDAPDRVVAITIDDGFACAHAHALPILARFGVPATVFVVAGLIGQPAAWLADARLPVRPILSAPQLRELAAQGVTIGSHTMRHASLDACPDDVLAAELRDSRQRLEDLLAAPVGTFAYPYGRHDRRVRDAVARAGYALACTTVAGRVRRDTDPLLLPRVSIFGDERPWQVRGKVRLGTNDMPPWSLVKQPVRRLLGSRTAAGLRERP